MNSLPLPILSYTREIIIDFDAIQKEFGIPRKWALPIIMFQHYPLDPEYENDANGMPWSGPSRQARAYFRAIRRHAITLDHVVLFSENGKTSHPVTLVVGVGLNLNTKSKCNNKKYKDSNVSQYSQNKASLSIQEENNIEQALSDVYGSSHVIIENHCIKNKHHGTAIMGGNLGTGYFGGSKKHQIKAISNQAYHDISAIHQNSASVTFIHEPSDTVAAAKTIFNQSPSDERVYLFIYGAENSGSGGNKSCQKESNLAVNQYNSPYCSLSEKQKIIIHYRSTIPTQEENVRSHVEFCHKINHPTEKSTVSYKLQNNTKVYDRNDNKFSTPLLNTAINQHSKQLASELYELELHALIRIAQLEGQSNQHYFIYLSDMYRANEILSLILDKFEKIAPSLGNSLKLQKTIPSYAHRGTYYIRLNNDQFNALYKATDIPELYNFHQSKNFSSHHPNHSSSQKDNSSHKQTKYSNHQNNDGYHSKKNEKNVNPYHASSIQSIYISGKQYPVKYSSENGGQYYIYFKDFNAAQTANTIINHYMYSFNNNNRKDMVNSTIPRFQDLGNYNIVLNKQQYQQVFHSLQNAATTGSPKNNIVPISTANSKQFYKKGGHNSTKNMNIHLNQNTSSNSSTKKPSPQNQKSYNALNYTQDEELIDCLNKPIVDNMRGSVFVYFPDKKTALNAEIRMRELYNVMKPYHTPTMPKLEIKKTDGAYKKNGAYYINLRKGQYQTLTKEYHAHPACTAKSLVEEYKKRAVFSSVTQTFYYNNNKKGNLRPKADIIKKMRERAKQKNYDQNTASVQTLTRFGLSLQ